MIRIVFDSMSFPSAGAISPLNRLPGKDTIMYSTGPISVISTPSLGCGWQGHAFRSYARALVLSASNSAWVIAPVSSRAFARSISAAGPSDAATERM